MSDGSDFGVVIPVGAGRLENLVAVVQALNMAVVAHTALPRVIVVVYDGPEAYGGLLTGSAIPIDSIVLPKHEPGMEQPRNVGVSVLRGKYPEVSRVWFLDSDVIVEPDCLEEYVNSLDRAEPQERVLIGPYEWMPPGVREPMHELQNDPRWPSFSQYGPDQVHRGDLSAGLACFSGNIVWPISEFTRLGGFWNDIHHGRCEDGELGLRAVAHDVPLSFVPLARGWHLWHDINYEVAAARNARDVPMLNARHPWVEGEEVFVVERDGARFDQRCPSCGELVNTILYWAHRETCGKEPAEGVVLPGPMP